MSTKSKFLGLLESGLGLASIPDGSTLVVAFSGGPDSSALLGGLVRLNHDHQFRLIAAHVNHQIRPGNSDRDEAAARRIAHSLGVDFVASLTDVPSFASKNSISIESAARQLRYRALAAIADSNAAFGVVTGHTQDDQAETVLLHTTRGSGLKGLAGMSYNSTLQIAGTDDSGTKLRILRPMLDTPGALSSEYCLELKIDPVIDESNSSRDYTRNKMRLDVLPMLNEVTPGSTRSLSRLAKNVSDDLELINWTVESQLSDATIGAGTYSRSKLDSLPASLVRRVIMKAYELHVGHTQNLERSHLVDMAGLLSGNSGTSLDLPNGSIFYVDRDSFGFKFATDNDDCPHPESLRLSPLSLPGTTDLGRGFTLSVEIVDRPKRLDVGNPRVTFTSPELISQPLTLRNRRNGDRFQPLGMAPEVKLQDFFVGAGVPERWRDRVPLIESERGIVWVAGYRLAEWAKVLPEHSKVARFEIA
jgi:tRNA(Ile)-lysidine synthase